MEENLPFRSNNLLIVSLLFQLQFQRRVNCCNSRYSSLDLLVRYSVGTGSLSGSLSSLASSSVLSKASTLMRATSEGKGVVQGGIRVLVDRDYGNWAQVVLVILISIEIGGLDLCVVRQFDAICGMIKSVFKLRNALQWSVDYNDE